jgi:hypothetical protein
MAESIDDMKKFADKNELTRPMGTDELADFFDMDAQDMEKLLLYYFTENGGVDAGTMTLPVFANFIVNDVVSDDTYSSMIDDEMLTEIKKITTFTNAEKMTALTTYAEIADLLEIDADTAKLMFVYYFAESADYDPGKMEFPAFVNSIADNVMANDDFADYHYNDEKNARQLIYSVIQSF